MAHVDLPSNFGKIVRVPAGLRSYCGAARREIVTDGTEQELLRQLESANGRFSQRTGQIGFVIECPVCGRDHNFPIRR